jgi:hypothetical protein
MGRSEGREDFGEEIAVVFVEPVVASLPGIDDWRAPAFPDRRTDRVDAPANREIGGSASRETQKAVERVENAFRIVRAEPCAPGGRGASGNLSASIDCRRSAARGPGLRAG